MCMTISERKTKCNACVTTHSTTTWYDRCTTFLKSVCQCLLTQTNNSLFLGSVTRLVLPFYPLSLLWGYWHFFSDWASIFIIWLIPVIIWDSCFFFLISLYKIDTRESSTWRRSKTCIGEENLWLNAIRMLNRTGNNLALKGIEKVLWEKRTIKILIQKLLAQLMYY